MSDYAIYVLQRHLVAGASVAPWEWLQGESGGWYSLRLTSGKLGSGGWVAGYIPRDGAISQIDLAVDLEAGADYEQLRPITIQLADQMASGLSMDAWMRSIGMSLAGAYVAVFSPAPTVFPAVTDAIWTGVIRSTRLTDTRIELACETPSDSDPIGEIISDSAIRPIVYGQASRLKLPPVGDAETEIVIEDLALCRRVPDSNASNAIGTDVVSQSPVAPVNLHKKIGNDWVIQIHAGMREASGYLTEYFPGGLVTEPDWYCEIVEGKGKGSSRRIKEGTYLVWGSGILQPPNYRDFTCQKVDGSSGGVDDLLHAQWEQQNYVQFVLEYPFLDEANSPIISPSWYTGVTATFPTYDDPKTTELIEVDTLQWNRYFSYAFESPLEDRSYVRIVRRPRKRALPITSTPSTDIPLFVKSGTDWVRVENAEEIYRPVDSGANLLLLPSASNSEKWQIFAAIPFDPAKFCLMNSPWPTTVQNLEDLFGPGIDSGDFSGTLYSSMKVTASGGNVDWMPQWWGTSHFSLMIGCDARDLANWEALWMCAKGEYMGSLTANGGTLVTALALHTSAAVEIYFGEVRPHAARSMYDHTTYVKNLRMTHREYMFETTGISMFLNSIPPMRNGGGDPYAWKAGALKLSLENCSQATAGISMFFGAKRNATTAPSLAHADVDLSLQNLALMLSRFESINDIYADISGPDYTSAAWSARINGVPFSPAGVALTSGISTTEPIADHVHAFEDIFRRHVVTPWTSYPVDAAAIEQACTDLWTKTQTSGVILPPATRPRLAVAITESAPQVGDVCAQLCCDGNIVGSRTGSGKRTAKAFLARTLLQEQDAIILESDLIRGSISEAPMSPLSKLCSAPLIRYAQQAGAPTAYIQVTHPDSDAWQPSYTIGFPDDSSALRAWSICHRGWRESGVAHARELRKDTIPDIDSLLSLVMQPRGTTFLDWLSRPKRTLSPMVAMSHAAVRLPRGSRVKLFHWKYAPTGAWGTIRRINMNLQADTAQLELVMDLDA